MSSITRVAEYAGVSITTVSRVLNNSPHPVNSDVRKRVLRAAKALNYSPSALARALVTQSTHIIGVIVGDASDPYFATIIRGISDAARAEGYLTIICNSDRIPDVELNFARLLRDYRADGIIFAGGGLTDESYLKQIEEILTWFQAHGVPVVVLGHHLFERPQVNIDNTQAARDMTEYLIELGHRRIGYITGPAGLTTSALRLEGYKLALARHGLGYDPSLVVNGEFTFEGGRYAAKMLIERSTLPTAIFGTNDVTAIGCLTSLKEQGIGVPDQISVVGFDNIAPTQYTNPQLTTIDVPMRDLGAMGVRQLLSALNPETAVAPVHLLPHKLIIRASSAPPPT
jgi:LacI family transcriptional regulator